MQETRVAHLEALGLSIPLQEGWYYHDEGFIQTPLLSSPDRIESVEAMIIDLLIRHLTRKYTALHMENAAKRAESDVYTNPYVYQMMRDPRLVLGKCLDFPPTDFGSGLESHVHVFYLDLKDEKLNLANRVHEETHAVTKLPSGLELLERYFLDRYNLRLDLSEIKDSEVLAELGAVATLSGKGYRPRDVLQQYGQKKSSLKYDFLKAIKLYEKAKGTSSPAKVWFMGILGKSA